jgi:hypothetical protein
MLEPKISLVISAVMPWASILRQAATNSGLQALCSGKCEAPPCRRGSPVLSSPQSFLVLLRFENEWGRAGISGGRPSGSCQWALAGIRITRSTRPSSTPRMPATRCRSHA